MRVRNIECQLAQGQVRRYLNGDSLSDVAVEQLEDHLNECEDCTEFFQECKQELIEEQSPIEIKEEAYAPAQTSASSEISPVPRFLIDAIRQKRETLDRVVKPIATHAVIQDFREEKPSLKSYTKPLAYSIGLAGVLIAMSTVMRDPSRVLGDRVETALPPAKTAAVIPTPNASTQSVNSTQPKTEPADPSKTEQATNSITTNSPTTSPTTSETSTTKPTNVSDSSNSASAKPTNTILTPVRTVSTAPTTPRRRTTTRRTTPNRPAARRQKPVSRPIAKKPASNPGIRVYDDNGNPVSNR